mgnify:CR=1 FL=1
MFQNLKTKNSQTSRWRNSPNAAMGTSNGFSHIPSAITYQLKGNEADRMVRCRFCGFPCDKEIHVKQQPESWAGLGISYGAQQTAGSSIGDARVPAAGAVAQTPDKYYDRTIVGGCPSCGSYLYWT